MRVMTQNRVTHVIEMGHLCFIEQNAILELARIAHHDAIAGDDVLAHVATAPNLAVFADPRRALQHRALLNNGSSADEHAIADEWLAPQFTQHGRLQPKLQITRDLFERIPDVILVLEQFGVCRVFKINKIRGGKHFAVRLHLAHSFPSVTYSPFGCWNHSGSSIPESTMLS